MNHLSRTFIAAIAITSTAHAGLLGYWTFDDDLLTDKSGKGYHAAQPGSPGSPTGAAVAATFSTDVPAIPLRAGATTAKSLDLTGGNKALFVTTGGSESVFNFPGNRFTISYWFKTWPASSALPHIAKNGESTLVQGWQSGRNSFTNDLSFTTRGVGLNSGAMTTSGSNPGVKAVGIWQHVALVYDGSQKHIYFNGVQVRSEAALNQSLVATTSKLTFGARHNASSGAWEGFSQCRLDDVAIFDNALGAAEVEDLARGADPRLSLRTTARPFSFGTGASAPAPPEGGPGYIGLREIRVNSQNFPGTTNSQVFAPADAVLYARTYPTVPPGAAIVADKNGASVPLQTQIDFTDPESGSTGANAAAAPFLTNAASTQDHFLQMAQGCFQVNTPGKYTFIFKGNEGMNFAFTGVNWEKLVTSNGAGAVSGGYAHAGIPTGDSNVIAVIDLPAGKFNWRYLWNDGTGSAWNEVFYSPGDLAAYGVTFKHLGDPSGGLQFVDHVPVADITVSNPFVVAGNPANITLTWDAAYATTVTLNGGAFSNQDVTAGTVKGLGSITTASPAATTTYTVTATRGAESVMKSVTVYVDQPPVVTSFTADDVTLQAGQPITFRWTASGYGSGPNSITISDGVTTTDVTANTSLSGSGAILSLTAPATTTVYTLKASNAIGDSSLQLTINVGIPPVFTTFSGDTSIEPDSAVTFTYAISGNPTSATFSPNISGTVITLPNGQVTERPTADQTYQMAATNAFGTANSSPITVQIVQPPQSIGVSSANWTLTLYKSASALMNNLTDADNLISGAIVRGNVTVNAVSTPTPITITNQPVVNLQDGAGDGAIAGGTWPTANWGTAAIEDFVVRATATLVVNDSADYTLNINNDDGGRLRIDLNNNGSFNDAGETVINDDVLSGPHTVTVEKFLSAGSYPIEYIYFERGGGAEGEVFYTNDQGLNVLIAAIPPVTAPILFPELRIVEIMAENSTGIQDGQGDREDWIEIYNGTGASRSLAGYYLTDDPLIPNKWAFPTTPAHTMASAEYFIVFASSKAITLPGDEYHTNFKLDPEGEYLALMKDNGMGGYTIIQEFNPFPPLTSDVSYGLYDTEHYAGFFKQTTPRKRNAGGYDGFIIGETHSSAAQGATPIHDRGFYTAPITVTLTKDDPNALLRYTTDGSTPTTLKGTTYTGPIAISSTTVLRSAAVRTNYIDSDVDTHTYIFVADVITQTNAQAVARGWPNAGDGPNGQDLEYAMSASVVTGNQAATMAALQAIPTISIVTDLDNLVHTQKGIYVNPGGRGRSFERPASIELLNDLGNGVGNFQKDSGLRVRGGFSRSVDNPKHAWHFYFRPEYSGDLQYPMFGTEGAADFEQLDLQCPQNYSWSFSPQNNDYTYTPPGGSQTTKRLRYNTFVREPVSRDLYGDMGQPYPRTRHYHCYVNGVYWGLYMSQERAEASFGETYLGGDKDNYDVVKSAGNAAGYNTEATDGTFAQGTSAAPGSAWAKLWWRTNEMRNPAGQTEVTRRASYFELMGLNPSGAPYNDPVAHPVVLDADSLIDYMIITWYCGSFDAPMSTFLGSASNNWFGMRDRLGNRGFVYFPHDFEHGMGTDLQTTGTWGASAFQNNIRSTDRTGPWGGSGTNYKGEGMYAQLATYIKSNPEYFHENLASCLEYRVKFWDRAHRHLTRPGGALTQANVLATIDARANVVRTAIIAESARWGDQKGVAASDFMPAPWDESITQLKDWIRQGTNAEYLTNLSTNTQGLGRGGRLIVQLRAYQDKVNLSDASNTSLPLYSPLTTPTFSNYGGVVAGGTTMTITNPNAGTTLYWSLDGTDPRLIGGGINPSPSVLTGASPALITLTTTGRVMARAYQVATQTWSALESADFITGTPATTTSLVITEINYNPKIGAPGTPAAGDVQSFEFIELQNISAVTTIDLTNVHFTNGLTYTFPTGRLLAPGERIVIVRDLAAFQSRYPDVNYPGLSSKTVGPWTGGLDNGGELLTLVDTYGATITAFAYDDDLPWPVGPDGNGATAVFTTTNPAAASEADGNNWFAHGLIHGNPGGPDITGYGSWAVTNGASVNGDGDGDGDSVKDVIEYLLGTNPTAASSVDKLPVGGRQAVSVGGVQGEYLTLTYTRAGGTGDVAVACETNNDLLAPANWLPNAVLVSRSYNVDGSETFVFRHPNPSSGDEQQFMRIKVTNP